MKNKKSVFCTIVQQKEKPAVLLEWIQSGGGEGGYFIIGRSRDGKHYHTIGSVMLNSNSKDELFYLYVDEKPLPGTSWYRVEQVNGSVGAFEKEIVQVEVALNNNDSNSL